MGKRRKGGRKVPLTLEQQITALGPRPTLDPMEPWMDRAGALAQIAWDDGVAELQRRIRERDADRARIVDPGRVAGNYGVSPYLSRHHKVENAPQDLAKSPDSKFPKRIATQRMIDRYKVRNQITVKQWRMADAIWQRWQELGLEPRMVASYDPVVAQGSASKDGLIAKKVDAVAWWNEVMEAIPYRSRGVVRAVVIDDQSASEWAKGRGYGVRDSGRIGQARLRSGLQALVDLFGY